MGSSASEAVARQQRAGRNRRRPKVRICMGILLPWRSNRRQGSRWNAPCPTRHTLACRTPARKMRRPSGGCLSEGGRVDDSAGATRPRTWPSLSPGGRTPSRKTPYPEGWPQWPRRGRLTIAPGSARGNRRGKTVSPEGGLQRPWRRECRAIGVARSLEAPLQGAVRAGALPRALPGATLRSARWAWRGGERRSLPLSARCYGHRGVPRSGRPGSGCSEVHRWRLGSAPPCSGIAGPVLAKVELGKAGQIPAAC